MTAVVEAAADFVAAADVTGAADGVTSSTAALDPASPVAGWATAGASDDVGGRGTTRTGLVLHATASRAAQIEVSAAARQGRDRMAWSVWQAS
ncbi:MAG: hypothetical protein OXG57_04620 [Acidimicrobiaceae bacterium]|nr:hypothetical protein [Acidimicrobiaceae bacterium]